MCKGTPGPPCIHTVHTSQIKPDKRLYSPLISFRPRGGFVMRIFLWQRVQQRCFCSQVLDKLLWGTHVYALTTGTVLMACLSPCRVEMSYYREKINTIPNDLMRVSASTSTQISIGVKACFLCESECVYLVYISFIFSVLSNSYYFFLKITEL